MKKIILFFLFLFSFYSYAQKSAEKHQNKEGGIQISVSEKKNFKESSSSGYPSKSLKKKIFNRYGIIGAMPEEIEKVLSLMKQKTAIKHGPRTFYTGSINKHPVVVVLSGIGKVNAAITSVLLLENFEVDAVINIGVAGGQKGVKHLDLVVSKSALYHDVDLTYFGKYKRGQLPGEEPEFLADERLVKKAVKVLDSLKIPYKVGRIASGDQFVYEKKKLSPINKTFEDIYAIEMEAGAIAQTCHNFKVPFIIFRSISDILGENSQQEEFNSFLARASEQAASLLIALLGEGKNE